MSRGVFVYRDGKLVPKSEAAPLYLAPMVIRDGQNPVIHPATGEMVDSKSKMRQITKDAGCIEIGTSDFPKPQPQSDRQMRDAVGRAIQMVKEGYKPSLRVVPGTPNGGGWHE